MGENSLIQWTTHTFNPWVGCQRVSPGCQNCYAEAYDKRVGGAKLPDGTKTLRWGPKAPRVRTSPSNWKKPLAWNRAAEEAGVRHRVFCSSLADVFEDRPELAGWRMSLLDLIRKTPHLDWLLLTKRPEHIRNHLMQIAEGLRFDPQDDGLSEWIWAWMVGNAPPPNVWLGTTVEDQQRADERIPALLEVPAEVRFLSCEPLLERIVLPFAPNNIPLINWVIIGGESGPGARPFHIDWARVLIGQCRDAGAAPFVKQLGARSLGFCRTGPVNGNEDPQFCDLYESSESRGVCGAECRLKLADPAGGDPREWPEDLRVREFPEVHRG